MKDALHVMIDLETLGTASDALILSIGAVKFRLDGNIYHPFFYRNISISDSLRLGCTVDHSTLDFWLRQPEDARKALSNPTRDPLFTVLTDFEDFYDNGGDTVKYVWSNGTDFDISILSNTYKKDQLKTPWFYTKARDYRTVIALAKDIKGYEKHPNYTESILDDNYDNPGKVLYKKIKHNALDDAIYQAHCLIEAYKLLSS